MSVGTLHRHRRGDEEGAVLLLVLFFVVGIGLSVAALVALSGTNLIATFQLQHERNLEYSANAAAEGAIQYLRPKAITSPCPSFPPSGTLNVDQNNLFVACLWSALPSGRVVQLAVCQAPMTYSACNASAVLVAQVEYADSNCQTGMEDQGCQYGTNVTIETWLIERANGG